MLRGAGLLDEAHAAMHLHAERGDLDADVGRERLGDRRQQRGALVARPCARHRPCRVRCGRSRRRWRSRSRARRAVERPHGQQHAPDVGMLDDRRSIRMPRPARGPACARAHRQRLLRRALGDADALQADREARMVHHREHAGEPAVLLADEVADRAAVVAVDHRAGRRARGCRACARSNGSARRCARRASRRR